jgi:hypothetical protein
MFLPCNHAWSPEPYAWNKKEPENLGPEPENVKAEND